MTWPLVESSYWDGICARCQKRSPYFVGKESNRCLPCRRIENVTTALATTATIDAEFEEQARPHREVINGYLELREWTPESDEDLQLATDAMNELRHIEKALEEAEKSLTGPIMQGVNRIRALCKPDRQRAAQALALMRDKIGAYARLRAARVAEAERLLTAAVQAQDLPAAAAAIQIAQPPPKVEGLVTYEEWDFEEFNHSIVPAELTQTVRAFVIAEIKRQVADGCQYPAIGGCKVFKKQIVRGRG